MIRTTLTLLLVWILAFDMGSILARQGKKKPSTGRLLSSIQNRGVRKSKLRRTTPTTTRRQNKITIPKYRWVDDGLDSIMKRLRTLGGVKTAEPTGKKPVLKTSILSNLKKTSVPTSSAGTRNSSGGQQSRSGGGGSGLSRDLGTPQDGSPQGKQKLEKIDAGRSPRNQAGETGMGSGPVAYDKWWPACVLVDQSYGDVNETVKGLVDHAAGCGVVLEVYAFTIKTNYPSSPDVINSNARKACNLTEILPDAKSASVQTLGIHSSSPGEMCGSPGASGCAEVGGGGGDGELSQKEQDKLKSGGHFGGQTSENVLASITNAPGANLASHEMLGHNLMSKPNGGEYGNGIGEMAFMDFLMFGRKTKFAAPAAPSTPFNSGGCSIMRGAALDNDGSHVYDPGQKVYYDYEDNPARQKDLMEGKSFFEDDGGGSGGDPEPPQREKPQPPDLEKKINGKAITKISGGSGHGGKPAISGVSSITSIRENAQKENEQPTPIASDKGPKGPPPAEKGAAGKEVGFDEDAPDPNAPKPNTTEKALDENFFAKGEGDSKGVTFDEEAADPKKKEDRAEDPESLDENFFDKIRTELAKSSEKKEGESSTDESGGELSTGNDPLRVAIQSDAKQANDANFFSESSNPVDGSLDENFFGSSGDKGEANGEEGEENLLASIIDEGFFDNLKLTRPWTPTKPRGITEVSVGYD